MKPSIQTRLFGFLGLFVLANTLLWGGLALLFAYIVEDEIIDRVMSSHISLIQESYRTTGQPPALPLEELRLYPDLQSVPPELRDKLDSGDRGGEVFTEDETHYHYRWLQMPGLPPVLLLAEVSPWLVVTHAPLAIFALVSAGFIVALLLGLLTAYQIARITTRPVRELTTAIGQIPRPDPLPHCEQPDEVGVLAAAMNAALTGLQEALSRETAFTRDISHELRTPLTTLRNAITLLPVPSTTDPHYRQLAKSCSELESLLDTLLALARAESTVSVPINLRSLLERLLLDRAATLEKYNFDIKLEIPDHTRVDANEQLSCLLLGNLLDNALHYADPQVLTVRIEPGSLVLENPLRNSESAPHSASLGHGLSLVERVAQAQDWQFSTELSGQRFTARLSWQ